ncbi:MAG TPA: thiamine pyrophosphate-binding protein, partial [Ilumatobacteraceae bacterium]
MITQRIEGHAGQQAIAAMMAFGTDVMFTLNGGHIWPLYEAARDQGMRVVDTRHEQTATFAAEGWAKLTRRPGLAALTAGPGITNGMSAITTAHFNGSPLVVLGGRAPELRWGSGSLQELDHVPLVASITKSAATVRHADRAGEMVHAAAHLAMQPHRGPTFLDFPLDVFGPSEGEFDFLDETVGRGEDPDPDLVRDLAELIAGAERPA